MMIWSATSDVAGELAASTNRDHSAFERIGGAAAAGRIATCFYRMVLRDGSLRPHFRADVENLCWHQGAQLTRALGGPDLYVTADVPDAYPPVMVAAELYHRSAGYLVHAVDREGAPRDVVAELVLALASLRCRVIGGYLIPGALVSPAAVLIESDCRETSSARAGGLGRWSAAGDRR